MNQQATIPDVVRNGVNVTALGATIDAVSQEPTLAEFRFSTKNHWISGGHNRSRIQQFYGCGQMDSTREEPFELDADEPPVLLGNDAGPNPVEFILHGLAGCMTTSMVYHAAARGIEIGAVESQFEGDLDLHGFLGMDDNVRKGYQQIRVTMRVQTEASIEQLRECVSFSPVFEMVSQSVPIELRIETH
ncbi:MAG: OsmC family protein [Pseudomonadales bacterium]